MLIYSSHRKKTVCSVTCLYLSLLTKVYMCVLGVVGVAISPQTKQKNKRLSGKMIVWKIGFFFFSCQLQKIIPLKYIVKVLWPNYYYRTNLVNHVVSNMPHDNLKCNYWWLIILVLIYNYGQIFLPREMF